MEGRCPRSLRQICIITGLCDFSNAHTGTTYTGTVHKLSDKEVVLIFPNKRIGEISIKHKIQHIYMRQFWTNTEALRD